MRLRYKCILMQYSNISDIHTKCKKVPATDKCKTSTQTCSFYTHNVNDDLSPSNTINIIAI